ncbi:MAG: hypothetical protein J6I47_07930, partial [Ruminococcus sp.]|nr:hypothetical protein [Ruminococcus sp.]
KTARKPIANAITDTAETTQNRDKSKCGKLKTDYVSSHVRYDHFDTTAQITIILYHKSYEKSIAEK